MAADRNQYGLARAIPADVAREVRQRCGFGCVICGSAFIQYDHLDPEFANAREHVASGIVLLCGGCHDRKTRGALSVETVREASQAPRALQAGFSFGPMDVGRKPPEIKLGELTCLGVESLITIDGESIFSVHPPEGPGAPYRLSAYLADSDGKETLRIVENEWRASTGNWDVSTVGARVTIRRAARDIVLELRSEPPNRVVVERLHMLHRGCEIRIKEGERSVIRSRSGQSFGFQELFVQGCRIAFDLGPNSCWRRPKTEPLLRVVPT